MALTLTCTKCGQKLAIADELKGKQVQCPKCDAIYVVEKKSEASSSSQPQPPRQDAGNQAKRSSKRIAIRDASDPTVATCPFCDSKMRLPARPGVSMVACPSCQQAVPLDAPENPDPIVTIDVVDEDPFADLPTTTPPSRPRPMGGASRRQGGGTAGSLTTTSPYQAPPAASVSHRPTAGGRSFLGPGLLMLVPYALVAIGTAVITAVAYVNRDANANPRDLNVLLIINGGLLISYFLVISGSIRMITGGPTWIGWATCILAALPSIAFGMVCFGTLFYPFAIGGSIWGIVLLCQPSQSQRAV